MDRPLSLENLEDAAKTRKVKLPAPLKKGILNVPGERDPKAEICYNANGDREPGQRTARQGEHSSPAGTTLPLQCTLVLTNPTMICRVDHSNDRRVMQAEVLPHVPYARVDYSKTSVNSSNPQTADHLGMSSFG